MPGPPHLAALDEEYELKPDRVRTHWDRPFDAVDYKVQDGDTLANIAIRTGLSAKYLMKYAFGTTDPGIVNWYLRMVVGCKALGTFGKNYEFTTSADPGLIWLPRQAYVRLTKKPPLSPGQQNCVGRFPRFRQWAKHSNCCWAVAGATLHEWKGGTNRSIEDSLSHIGSDWLEKYEKNRYLQGPTFEKFGRDAGLLPLKLGSFLDDNYWVSRIQANKPFLLLQEAYGEWTHWVIVVGYEVNADHKLWIWYQDPADGTRSASLADYLYASAIDARTKAAKVWSA